MELTGDDPVTGGLKIHCTTNCATVPCFDYKLTRGTTLFIVFLLFIHNRDNETSGSRSHNCQLKRLELYQLSYSLKLQSLYHNLFSCQEESAESGGRTHMPVKAENFKFSMYTDSIIPA